MMLYKLPYRSVAQATKQLRFVFPLIQLLLFSVADFGLYTPADVNKMLKLSQIAIKMKYSSIIAEICTPRLTRSLSDMRVVHPSYWVRQ